jgi:DNA-binding transcriptional ArsR family regulator
MTDAAFKSQTRTETELPGERHAATDGQQPIDTESLLAMLGDEYAPDILAIISEESLSAREIASRLNVSRPTIYRRLNRLQEAGLVTTSMEYDPDGHHRQQFHLAINEVVLRFESDRIAVNT